MAYSFDQIFAADPSNPSNVAQNASITIFAPGDGTMTPLTITDPDGQPLNNPVPVNANGFGSAFAHATLDRVAWAGGGFTGFFTSYEGMKNEAVAAKEAAEAAAATAGADAAAVADAAVATVIADADAAATSAAAAAAEAQMSAVAAANSAALVGTPADTAIAAAVTGSATNTHAALESMYAKVGPNSRRGTMVPVATRTSTTYMRQKSDGTQTQETSRTAHWITADCFNLRIYYGNIGSNANAVSPIDGDNTITVKCDVEGADTKRTRGWSATGSRTITIEPGGRGFLDVSGTFKKGDRIFVRTHVSVASLGQRWPRGMTTNTGSQAGIGEGVTTGADLTLPSTTAVTQTFTWVYCPSAILGETAAPVVTVAQIGDSIAASQADAADLGFILRALNGNYGHVNLAQQGETSGMYLAVGEGGGRAYALDHVTHAICEYGVNDIYNNARTLAGWQADSLLIWSKLAQRGIKVFQTTITPKSTSTDSWATLANQTAAAQTAIRNSANDWLRAGSPIDPTTKAAVAIGTAGALLAGSAGHPLTGYFEVADTVESARNSGLWKVTGAANYATSDGTHPSSAAHQLMAAGIDVTKLTL